MMTEKEFQEYMALRFMNFFRSEIKNNERFKQEFLDGLIEAKQNILERLEKFYKEFSDLEEISLADAKRLLSPDEIKKFQMDVMEYIRLNELDYIDEELQQRLKEASIAYRSSRLDQINAEVDMILSHAYDGMTESLEVYLTKSYLNVYNHTAYEIFKGFRVGVGFNHVNTLQLKQVFKIPWTKDDLNYVDRLRFNQAMLRRELPQILEETIIEGLSYTEATKRFSKRINTSINNAQALVVTEHAYVTTLAQTEMYEELGVEKYQIVATLDTVTSEICQEQDLKIYKMSEMATGITAPPFHPNCRTTTVPYFDYMRRDGYTPIDRVARNKNGKTYRVAGNLPYRNWYYNEYGKYPDEV